MKNIEKERLSGKENGGRKRSRRINSNRKRRERIK
jgi:hypothetical protein